MRKLTLMLLAVPLATVMNLAAQTPQGWQKGKGYGWVYGSKDEVGALNAIAKPEWVLKALQLVKTGRVYDLGVPVDKRSYRWPGHAPTEIMSYRSPDGVKRQKDIPAFASNAKKMAFHSCALYTSDNIGTQIDGLGHITSGDDNHWYNGYKEADYGGDFGLLKMDADRIPPVIARAVLIDVAGFKKLDALPANYAISVRDLEGALKAQGVDVEPGDVVLIRTGTLRYWGEAGADHAKIAQHDSAGISLAAARWLVEQKGAVMIGSDTSGLEVGVDPEVRIPNAVHEYLLVQQGVHIGEFHNLEALARDRVYRFVYVALTNRFKGTTAGFALRPIAIQ
ncbi:MAG: cyclase family protein [Bryobacteraceae bacterium]|nr:cyclase family protein [Bryobacteraceae bacterium]MDW8380411.1 cyclase family protein [Bryobacterales bacterium]